MEMWVSAELPILICYAKIEKAEVSVDGGLYVDVSVDL